MSTADLLHMATDFLKDIFDQIQTLALVHRLQAKLLPLGLKVCDECERRVGGLLTLLAQNFLLLVIMSDLYREHHRNE